MKEMNRPRIMALPPKQGRAGRSELAWVASWVGASVGGRLVGVFTGWVGVAAGGGVALAS